MFELLIVEAPDMDSVEEPSQNAQAGEMKTNLAEALESNDIRDRLAESIAMICESLTIKATWPKIMPLVIQALRTTSAPANTQIPDFVRKSNWAGMQILGIVSHGAARHFKEQLGDLMSLVMPFLESNSLRILHSTLGTLGELSEEFFPLVQRLHGPIVLKKLGSVMSTESLPVELKQRAVSCLTHFTKEMLTKAVEDDDEDEAAKVEPVTKGSLAELEPFMTMSQIKHLFQGNFDCVANGLLALFKLSVNTNNYDLLSNVLVAISILSNILTDEFVKCYSFFSEGLRTLLTNLLSDSGDEKMTAMQVQLMETFTFLMSGCSEDPEQKKAVIKDFESMFNFIQNLVSNIGIRDDRRRGASTFFSMMAIHFKPQFIAQKEFILKHLFDCMSLDIALKVEDKAIEQATGPQTGIASFNIDLKVHGGEKVLSLDYEALNIKQTAMEVFVDVLKHLADSLDQNEKTRALQIVQDAFPKNSSSEVKKHCFKLIKLLIRTIPQSEGRIGVFESCLPFAIAEIRRAVKIPNRENVYTFSRKLISIMREVCRPSKLVSTWNRSRPLIMNTAGQTSCVPVDNLFGNLDSKKPRIPNNYEDLVQLMGEIMDYQSVIKARVKEEYKNETMDDEMLEDFEEAFAEGNEIFQVVMELFGELLKFDLPLELQTKLTQVFSKSFFGLQPKVQSQIQNLDSSPIGDYLNPDEMMYLSCWVCDLAENLDLQFLMTLVPQLDVFSKILAASCSQTPDILQNIAYYNNVLISRMASNPQPSFTNNLLDRLQFLTQLFQTIITMSQMDPESFRPPSDNCVAALVRFVLVFKNNLFNSDAAFASGLKPYLNMLPLEEDHVEGVLIHTMITGLFKQCMNGQITLDEGLKAHLQESLVRIMAIESQEADKDEKFFQRTKLDSNFVCYIQRKELVRLMKN